MYALLGERVVRRFEEVGMRLRETNASFQGTVVECLRAIWV